jgi:hypothetical protein
VRSKTPGPGTYDEQRKINADGRQLLSNDLTSCVPTFRPPKKKNTRVIATDFTKQNPGPGTYSPSQTAVDMAWKYRNNNSFNLYVKDRKIELHDKTKKDIPGPGTYRVPSDFGHIPLSQKI